MTQVQKTQTDLESLKPRLKAAGQEHVSRAADRLDPAGRAKLAGQLAGVDLSLVGELVQSHVLNKPPVELPAQFEPVKAYPHEPDTAELKGLYDRARARGLELLRGGKVGAFVVAGGQGTRLGYDGPKGEYPVTPIKSKPLFHVFAEQLLAWSRDVGRPVPWYVMTSDVNDEATRAFFKANAYFGLNPDDVYFFEQGMMPILSMTDGRMLIGEDGTLSMGPDGHGGSLRALDKSGALADMRRRGVEHLSYFQVDNPLVHVLDPLFVGLHDLTGSEMSSKTVPKAGPLEKVGNFVASGGAVHVIEYSDLPRELAEQTAPDGGLRFNAGSIAIHALRVSFVERLNAGGQLHLPWHRAEKKYAYLDDSGKLVKPAAPNAVKLEQFVFDAIPLAKNAIVYTTDRAEEFSPVKNAEGGDSPATCRRDQIRRAARWLKAAGVEVPTKDGEPDATLEISPLYATSAEQLRQRGPKVKVQNGAVLYFGSNGVEGDA